MTADRPQEPRAAVVLQPENSFRRLREPIRLLVTVPAGRREALVPVIFRWPPAYVELLAQGDELALVVAPLNAFQVIELLDEGARVHYEAPGRCFVPWGRALLSEPVAGSVVAEDGTTRPLPDPVAGDGGAPVRPLLPPVRARDLGDGGGIAVELRLIAAHTRAPRLLWFEPADVPWLL